MDTNFGDLDIKKIIKTFNKTQNNKSGKTTHIIQYIFTQNDLEACTYKDIYKLLSTSTPSSNCIFDIMMVTLSHAAFIHIEKGRYSITKIDNGKFFIDKTFDEFIKIAKSYNKKNMETIFVFGGHCDGWYCYCAKYVINFNMIRSTFIKYKLDFDLICFDSCYTSSVEIIYQYYDLTKYMITHQTYVGIEGFNSDHMCQIFDSNMPFNNKILISVIDFLKRSKSEKDHGSAAVIDCAVFGKLFDLLKKHFTEIRKIVLHKDSKKFLTDPCGEWMDYCKTLSEEKPTCDVDYCNNIKDLYGILTIFNNKEMLKLFKEAVINVHNNIPLNPKYFNNKIKFQGVNIIVNAAKTGHNEHYEKLRFYKDFF